MASDFVGIISGEGWVAVNCADDVPDKPVLAFRLRADGRLIGTDGFLQDMSKAEYFSHYKRADK